MKKHWIQICALLLVLSLPSCYFPDDEVIPPIDKEQPENPDDDDQVPENPGDDDSEGTTPPGDDDDSEDGDEDDEEESPLNPYYQDIDTSLSGSALKAAIHNLLDETHSQRSYKELWTILKESDADPENPNNVILFYSRRSQDARLSANVDSSNQDYWNREHVWPKSHGIEKNSEPFTDAHHIRPSDMSVNASRQNYYFIELPDDAARVPETSDCRFDVVRRHWEPGESIKGDVARMMFYMSVRYENNPDLELIDRESFGNLGPNFGGLNDLLMWHELDPVDESERRRNDIIFKWQGNRNPFIDNPQWVSLIF